MNILKVRNELQTGKTIFDLNLRVVYYARVSTEKDEQLNSLDNQVEYFESFIKNNSNWIFSGGYIDEGISGGSDIKRENFMKMIEDAKADNFDYIITKEISRFSRNTLDSIKYTRELLNYGVAVYFQSDNINTIEPDSELRLTIMSSIAQDEIRKLSERLKFGYNRAKAQKRILGQNNLYGYDKKNGKLEIKEDEAEVIREIFTEYAKGKKGLKRIARDLEKKGIYARNGKMFSYGTLQGIIKNPKYKGYYTANKYQSVDYRTHKSVRLSPDEWICEKDPSVPAIITEELWEKANSIMSERGSRFKEHKEAYQNRYTYSGKIFCGEHNTTFHRHIYKSKKGERECWNCRLYRLKGKKEGCDSPTVYTDEIDSILLEVYSEIYKKRDEIIDNLTDLYGSITNEIDYSKKIASVENSISDINKRKDKLLDLSIDGSISNSEFKERNNSLNKEIEKLNLKITEYKSEALKQSNNSKKFSLLKKELNKIWTEKTIFNNEISDILLDKIIVTKLKDNTEIKLDIFLKTGVFFEAAYKKTQNGISVCDIGISQAQVSRLEKGALKQMKKYM